MHAEQCSHTALQSANDFFQLGFEFSIGMKGSIIFAVYVGWVFLEHQKSLVMLA